AGAASDHSVLVARSLSQEFPISQMFSSWRRTTAVFGRLTTSDAQGVRSLMASQLAPLERSLLRRRIRTLFMEAAAKGCGSHASRPAMVSTSRLMVGRHGLILACATASRSDRYSSILAIPIVYTSPFSGILMVLMRNAAFFARLMED